MRLCINPILLGKRLRTFLELFLSFIRHEQPAGWDYPCTQYRGGALYIGLDDYHDHFLDFDWFNLDCFLMLNDPGPVNAQPLAGSERGEFHNAPCVGVSLMLQPAKPVA